MANGEKSLLKVAGKINDTRDGFSLNYLVFVVFSSVSVSLALLLMRGAFPTPFSDEFYFYKLYADAKEARFDFKEIFRPHFGHIYVLLKSWFWLLIRYGIDWRVSMYVQVVFVLFASALVAKYSVSRAASSARWWVAISIILVFTSARQNENLYWAIQISAAAMLLFTVAAFYLVARFSETQKTAYAILGCASAFIALLSNGGGIVSFFIVVVAVFILARNLCLKLIFAALGLVFLVSIVSFMLASSDAGAQHSLLTARGFLIYVLAFFANSIYSFSDRGDDVYSLCVGLVVLGGTACLLMCSWSSWHKNIYPILLIGFSIISCFLIAYARLRGGVWQPNASRYYPFAAMIIVGNLLIILEWDNNKKKYWLAAVTILVMLSFFQAYFVEWRRSPHRFVYSKSAHLSLCVGGNEGLAFHGDIKYVDVQIMRKTFCAREEISQLEMNSQPILLEIGPIQTKSKMPFNQQPDGRSALWARVEKCEQFCMLVFSGMELPVVVNESGTFLTAFIPPWLYESTGDKSVYLINTYSGKKSKSLTFHVH